MYVINTGVLGNNLTIRGLAEKKDIMAVRSYVVVDLSQEISVQAPIKLEYNDATVKVISMQLSRRRQDKMYRWCLSDSSGLERSRL